MAKDMGGNQRGGPDPGMVAEQSAAQQAAAAAGRQQQIQKTPAPGTGTASGGGGQLTVLALIEKQKAEFLKVIPRHLNPERMIRIAQSAISRNKQLLACTAPSLLRSVMEASIMGLEIGVLGEGYLIPYKTDCTFQPGYRGLIKLAIQSKAVLSVNVGAVYPGDVFDHAQGSEPFVKHQQRLDPNESTELPDLTEKRYPFAVYCALKLPSGCTQVTVMSRSEVERVRKRSMAASNGPWVTDYEQMAIKTVIKRGLKLVPLTPELRRALEVDEAREIGQGTRDIFGELPSLLPGEDAVDVTPAEEEKKDTVAEAAAILGATKTDTKEVEQVYEDNGSTGPDRDFEKEWGKG